MFFCLFPEVRHVITSDVEACRSKLADYYKRTAKVPTSVWSSVCQVKLDQIFTRLSWVKKEQTPTGTSQSKLRDYGELFTADENGVVPKRILAQGETGIGKTTFVKKLALDWAKLNEDKDVVNEEMAAPSKCGGGEKMSREHHVGVSQAESSQTRKQDDSRDSRIDAMKKFQLVIVVPLKYVSKCQTFREVLSCSRLIPRDEESLTDDLFKYVCNNQEKVLLVFDGYDEYRTGSVAEAQFGPRITSPICEIFHGNVLRDCTVLVATRSSRAGELQGSVDKHAEITGFDREDKLDFMSKMLDSSSKVTELDLFLRTKEVSDLARVPLLNLFFCLLFKQEKENLMELGKRKTPLYRAIIRYILQYSNKRLSPAKVSKVKEEDYREILAEIGKVALESLLKGSQVFEYGQLSEKVRGEESVMVGLLQLSENEASLEPTEIVSFVHKSIQEYLAAWFIANRCVPQGNLGGIESHAATLEDFQSMVNVFYFVCGLSKDGAVKVLTHLSSVRANDVSVDLSVFIPVEKTETDQPWTGITERHRRFNDLVLSCFEEGSLEPELVAHVFGCTGGIILLEKPVGPDLILKPEGLTQQPTHSWAFLFCRVYIRLIGNSLTTIGRIDPVVRLYESVKFLDLLHIPVRIITNSKLLKLEDFLTMFLNCDCTSSCLFNSVLCFRDDKAMVYITDLRLKCDAHISMFTEAAATVSDPSFSTDLFSRQSCIKFLTSLTCFPNEKEKLLKELTVAVRNCKHLQEIKYRGNGDYVLEFLEEVAYSWKLFLTINSSQVGRICRDDQLHLPVPRREENISVMIDLLCNQSTETAMVIVSSISPESVGNVTLIDIVLSPSAAATLGEVLPKMTSLRRLGLIQDFHRASQVVELRTLFKGFNQVLPLERLNLSHFCVVGSFAPLTNNFRFFPDLKELVLVNVTLDGDGLCLLLEGFRFIPHLQHLNLSFNPLGPTVRVIVRYLDELPELRTLQIYYSGDRSDQDLKYVWKAAKKIRPELSVNIMRFLSPLDYDPVEFGFSEAD